MELTARIIATNMYQRIWNLVYEDCEGERTTTTIGDEKHAEIMHDLKPILLELIELCSKAVPELSDEYVCLEKIGQCVKIIDFIEEEFKVSLIKSFVECVFYLIMLCLLKFGNAYITYIYLNPLTMLCN